jgi:hypothetical protein
MSITESGRHAAFGPARDARAWVTVSRQASSRLAGPFLPARPLRRLTARGAKSAGAGQQERRDGGFPSCSDGDLSRRTFSHHYLLLLLPLPPSSRLRSPARHRLACLRTSLRSRSTRRISTFASSRLLLPASASLLPLSATLWPVQQLPTPCCCYYRSASVPPGASKGVS